MKTFCHWRSYVNGGYLLWTIDDFELDQCVLISPRTARLEYNGMALPYFQVHAALRRHIWESMTFQKVPKNSIMRHRCLERAKYDSRGLCINPHHLSIGSRDDNRMDSRVEYKIRESLGYWKPETYSPLPPLPLKIKWDTSIHNSKDETTLWTLSVRNEPLTHKEKSDHNYCKQHAKIMGPKMKKIDLDLLERVGLLLDAMKYNLKDDVNEHLTYLLYMNICSIDRGRKCAYHSNVSTGTLDSS